MPGLLHGPEPFGAFGGSRSNLTRTCSDVGRSSKNYCQAVLTQVRQI